MGVFTRETIYGHMSTDHGGFFDNENPLPVHDYQEQVEALQRAAARRRQVNPPVDVDNDLLGRQRAQLAEARRRQAEEAREHAAEWNRRLLREQEMRAEVRREQERQANRSWCTIM
ncbi:hypothetical protein OF83DRAFT_155813 [Amylostereum chailletii]|nr:hypothetical protein OF83DRAFT_155813 [Amylostereum chailletii]